MELAVRFKQGPYGVNPTDWEHIHPDAKTVFEWLAFTLDRMGYDTEITSLIRPHTTDSGIHATGRAIDCVPRPRDDVRSKLTYEQFQKLCGMVCFVFRRPSVRPSCIYHDAGSGNHFHIQVDPQYTFIRNKAGLKPWVDLKGEAPQLG